MNREKVDRIVDVASVALISIAAVASAFCSYQSGRWGGRQAELYSLSNASRIQAAGESARSLALTAIDVNVFLNYVAAREAGDAGRARFILFRVRPEMRPALTAWLATKPFENPKAPASPFVMKEYALHTAGAERTSETTAQTTFSAALEANKHSDEFLLLTVVFAGVSFLGGMSTKMTYPRHAVIIAVGTAAAIYGLVRVLALPIL